LRKQARDNPTAFMSLLGRILPTQVNATVKTELTQLSDAEFIAIIASGEDEHRAVH
jgi:hypothetical protein